MKSLTILIPIGICLFSIACQSPRDEPVRVASQPSTWEFPKTDIPRSGEFVYQELLRKTPATKLDVWGTGFPTVKACLWIAEDDWNSLSTADREALIGFLKAQVPLIRKQADRYVGIPSTAPLYQRMRNNIANMRDDSFIIFTMVRKDGQWIQNRTVAESK